MDPLSFQEKKFVVCRRGLKRTLNAERAQIVRKEQLRYKRVFEKDRVSGNDRWKSYSKGHRMILN